MNLVHSANPEILSRKTFLTGTLVGPRSPQNRDDVLTFLSRLFGISFEPFLPSPARHHPDWRSMYASPLTYYRKRCKTDLFRQG